MRLIKLTNLFLLALFLNVQWSYATDKAIGNAILGSIAGTIVDSQTLLPIEFVTVALQKSSDSSLVTGVTTDAKGKFELRGIAFGQYRLKYFFVGYQTGYLKNIQLSAQKKYFSVDTLFISPRVQKLDEVIITGEKSVYETKIDRKIFNVEKDIVGQSGTASDVLQHVPSVSVDVDGNVSLRGSSNVTILINGKPSMLNADNQATILQQIPANTIDKIEVITNPSAKYDPDGTSGILNIVLKEGASQGVNGSVAVNVGNNNKYNATANVSYNPGKYNFFASYGYRNEPRWFKSVSNSQNIKNDTTTYNNENEYQTRKMESHLARIGFDYNWSKTFSTGINESFQARSRTSDDMLSHVTSDKPSDTLQNLSFRRHTSSTDYEYIEDVTINFLKKFEMPGREWRTDFTFDNDPEHEKDAYMNYLLEQPNPYLQELYKPSTFHRTYTIQSDLTWPINENAKLESGYKGIIRSTEIDLNAYSVRNDSLFNELLVSNIFKYDENIQAAYGTYSQTLGKFSLMAGLRFEAASTQWELFNQKGNPYNYYSPFPSLHLVEKFDDDNELNLSYSRRINRPNPRQIIPFPNYSNPNSLFIGNPSIRPEYISSVEFGYSKKIGNLTLQPALFYRLTTDAIRPYTAVIDKNHVVSFAVNLSKNTAEGLEMVAMYQVFKFWNINFSGTIYNQTIYSGNLNDPSLINEINLYLPLKYKIDSSDVKPVASQKNAFSWDGKIISSTYLPLGFGLQISGFYRSPFITPQGTSQPFYSVNIGLKKDVLKGKGTFTISASDIFNTMKFEIQSNSSNLIADSWRKRESRIVYAGFTYRFGKVKQSKKPKKENVDEGAPQDDLMY